MNKHNYHYRNIKVYIIIIIMLLINSCKTLTLTEMIANDILDYINYGGDRYDNSVNYTNNKMEVEKCGEVTTMNITEYPQKILKKEVRKMEDINTIITAIGSAIAGIYCAIKTIIGVIKKVKKN